MDYASRAKELSFERIRDIANGYLNPRGTLEEAFETKFGQPLPGTLNESHRSLIVAESMDTATERIVRYLSDMGVPVNVATVQHFRGDGGREMLAQVFLVPRSQPISKRTTGYRTVNQLQDLAEENGVGDLYRLVREGVSRIFTATPYRETVGYYRRLDDGRIQTVMFVEAVPAGETGGLGFTIHATRFGNCFKVGLEDLKAMLPGNVSKTTKVRSWRRSSEEEQADAVGLGGAFHTTAEVDTFIKGLQAAARQ